MDAVKDVAEVPRRFVKEGTQVRESSGATSRETRDVVRSALGIL